MSTTNAELASKLLREAAEFYRTLGDSSPEMKDRMDEFGVLYEQVAALLDANPAGLLADNPQA
ncbi:MAG: hypothetical protein U0S49_06685 [Rhodospirillales bacterium]|jgi:hypothetical protein|nr:hypothetical protein [Rhodospirillales bacterium]